MAGEASIEHTPAGAVPSGAGWFVLNVRGARGFASEGHGVFCPFEAPDAPFEHVGVNVHVLQPGDRSSLYHAESAQEGFLVLAGECIAVVEEHERPLHQWDYLHCPPGTAHALIGAGDGPCAILMVGARIPGASIVYPPSEVAAQHGLSAPIERDNARQAYSEAGWHRDSAPMPMPWPE